MKAEDFSIKQMPFVPEELQGTHDPYNFSEDMEITSVDVKGRHCLIFGLQADTAGLRKKPFDRCLALHERHDDLAGPPRGLLPDQDRISIEDMGVDHAFALHRESKEVLGRFKGKKGQVYGNLSLPVLRGQHRLTCRDPADERDR